MPNVDNAPSNAICRKLGFELREACEPVVGSSDPAGPHRLAVIELPSGNGRVVKGSKVPGGWVLVAWASSGNEVFLTGGSTRQSRVIVAYRLGEDRARRLAVEVPAFYGIAAS